MQQEQLRPNSITTSLDVQGWQHLDAVLLAALATEFPVLLIGPHGTAKTLLVERLSNALGLEFRHYNASLLNYDDLVGIPMPDDTNDRLHFVTTPGAIWDAEFVFFDEISRCRPDLQNKLFPVIHERRVVGMNLDNLRYRWSAMNPPSPDNPDLENATSDVYLGSEPLDPALTDRFPFVIPVPTWRELSREDRRAMLSQHSFMTANGTVESYESSLPDRVEATRDRMAQVEEETANLLVDYMIAIMDLLDKAHLSQSPRRARMLTQSIMAIHAARLTLEGEDADLADSAELALLYGLPQNATDVPPTPATIVAIHKQAWEITYMLDDEVWRSILEEQDPVKRIILADDLQLNDEELSRVVTQALAAVESEARKISIATAIFLRFSQYRSLTPAAWEPLSKLAGRVLLPRFGTSQANNNSPDMNVWNEMKTFILENRGQSAMQDLQVNYLIGCFPDVWRQSNWREALAQFTKDLELFGVKVGDDDQQQ